jgi:beta propeller repeat protein
MAAASLLLASGPSMAARAQQGYEVDSFSITDRARKDQTQPRVSGSWVVWKDYRDLDRRVVDESPNAELIGMDLDSRVEYDVARTRDAGDPAISGSIVVWTAGGMRNGTEIRGVDLGNGEVFAVTSSKGKQERPAIAGTLIVWQDNRDGNWDIYGRDLVRDGDFAITDQWDAQDRPAVSGRTVVWQDWRDRAAGPDIYGVDIDSRQKYQLSQTRDAWEPAISGRWVVWVSLVDPAVWAHHLDEGKTRRLTQAVGAKSQPAISGEIVVWTDERNGNRDIYGHDLVTGTEFVVVKAPLEQSYPHIDGTRVVWADARGPNRDVWAAQLSIPRLAEAPAGLP